MNNTSPKTTSASRSASSKSSPDSTPDSLAPLAPLKPKPFPNLFELASEDRQSQKVVSRQRGLFEELLGRPEALFIDSLEFPEKYEEQTSRLLRSLVSGERRLEDVTAEEMALLDRATVDFASAPPPAKKVEQRRTAAPRREAAVAGPVAGEDVPLTELPPFWWL